MESISKADYGEFDIKQTTASEGTALDGGRRVNVGAIL
jgi:hypothetical protein